MELAFLASLETIERSQNHNPRWVVPGSWGSLLGVRQKHNEHDETSLFTTHDVSHSDIRVYSLKTWQETNTSTYNWLVLSTHLKNMKVSWGDDIPNIWNKNVTNHQSDCDLP